MQKTSNNQLFLTSNIKSINNEMNKKMKIVRGNCGHWNACIIKEGNHKNQKSKTSQL